MYGKDILTRKKKKKRNGKLPKQFLYFLFVAKKMKTRKSCKVFFCFKVVYCLIIYLRQWKTILYFFFFCLLVLEWKPNKQNGKERQTNKQKNFFSGKTFLFFLLLLLFYYLNFFYDLICQIVTVVFIRISKPKKNC